MQSPRKRRPRSPDINIEKKKFKPMVRFNISNRIITCPEIQDIVNGIFRRMNQRTWRKNNQIEYIEINDANLFIRAFTHTSYILEMRELEKFNGHKYPIPEKDYEVFEFLGDSLLSFLIINILVSNFEDENEHFLTLLKIRLIKKETYASFSKFLGFDKYVLISSYLEGSKDQGRRGDSILEDVFEAFFGSILRYFGFVKGVEVANNFITGIFEEQINFTKLIMTPDNFKDCVIQYFRSMDWGNKPGLEELYHNGPPNSRSFGMILKLENSFISKLPKEQIEEIEKYNTNINNMIPQSHMNDEIRQQIIQINEMNFKIIGLGIERSKKKGEQQASKDALRILRIDPNFILLNGSHTRSI